MSARLLNRRVQVERRVAGAEDRFGNPVYTWQPVGPATRAYVERDETAEATGTVDVQTSVWTVVLPAGTDVTGRDRLRLLDRNPELVLNLVGPADRPAIGRVERFVRLKATTADVAQAVA